MSEAITETNSGSDWNIDTLIEELFRELNGSVSRSTIEQTFRTLIANYEDAPVKLFVPILVHRQAKELLREIIAERATMGGNCV